MRTPDRERKVRAHRCAGEQRGLRAYGPLEATSLEKIERQFDVNVLGLLATTRAVLPHFRANRGGTKFAVEGLSESLYYELGAIGVRVKLIEPGMIETDFGGSRKPSPIVLTARPGMARSQWQETDRPSRQRCRDCPADRIEGSARSCDKGRQVGFPASAAASFVSGSIVTADGGSNA